MAKFKKEKKITDMVVRYQRLFDSEDGKIILHDLMKSCHILRTTFDTAERTEDAIYNEGARSVVLRILQTINTDPAQLLELIERGNQKEQEYE